MFRTKIVPTTASALRLATLAPFRSANINVISRMRFSSFPPHTVVAMPALSPTMESGSISKWNVKEGDKFVVDTSICDVETDKAVVSFNATDDGYIAKILVSGGEIKVGQPIIVTVEEEKDIAAFKSFTLDNVSGGASTPKPSAEPVKQTSSASAVAPAPATPSSSSSSSSRASSSSSSDGSRLFASPFARKLAKESGTSVEEIAAQLKAAGQAGSGPNGRIVAEDVMRASTLPKAAASVPAGSAAPAKSAVASPASVASTTSGVYNDFQLSDFAKNLAARMTQTKQVVPHYYLSVELNLTNLLAARAQFNAMSAAASKGSKKAPAELSVLDFVVKAAGLAMKQVPDVNGAWMDTFVRRYNQVDINLVMGAGNFVATPVIRNVNSKGLSAVSQEIVSFEDSLFAEDDDAAATAARDADKMAVGTFSIHNLGMYGVKSAAPIVLAPQACALALGAIVDTVVPATPSDENGNQDWATAPMLTATLSCDHRVVDGAVGAQWLAAFKQLVENPMSMLL